MDKAKTAKLIPFEPSTQAAPFHIEVSVLSNDSILELTYSLTGKFVELVIPELADTPTFREGLYQHTCFEAFIGGKSEKYIEFNFSPSGDRCIYFFDTYRMPATAPETSKKNFLLLLKTRLVKQSSLEITVVLDLSKISFPVTKLGLSAVLEHTDGSLSYWALTHGKEKPDFHDSANFTITL